ncbi:DUF485 domain-containing protein [Rhodocyclus tenuis]|uniref:DUF485 domain-containing protein n=2 Tax=Rhodocyclus TaxID=1064 RepID=A0A6L5JYQ2_RHOTE|nr:DUF485 domain-containing protein [Rhodocyclus gracilis]MQY52465.1 DUF485 domain-containing protein [Rhodocyclus gracilis]MRD74041.1 DUF485 domain-containing protein [Rhodocyclus gracilis]NJA88612.1 DUF485 domain-containing protein [Rhodocyclus gracilis]
MKDDIVARIVANPKYQQLKSTRASFSIIMALLVMVIYYGYILLIAFDKELLAQKLGEGMVTSIGIPMGVGVIVLTVILTNIYVRRANTEFDALNDAIVREEANK